MPKNSIQFLDNSIQPVELQALIDLEVIEGSNFSHSLKQYILTNATATYWNLITKRNIDDLGNNALKELWNFNVADIPTNYNVNENDYILSVDGVGSVSVTGDTDETTTAIALVDAANTSLTDGGNIVWAHKFVGSFEAEASAPDISFRPRFRIEGIGNAYISDGARQIFPHTYDTSSTTATLSSTGVFSWNPVELGNFSNKVEFSIHGANDGGYDVLRFRLAVATEVPVLDTVSNEEFVTFVVYRRQPQLLSGNGNIVWTLITDVNDGRGSFFINPTDGNISRINSLIAGIYTFTARATNTLGFDEKTWTVTVT